MGDSSRVIIENVLPQLNGGLFPVKRIIGEAVKVTADLFTDGHQRVAGNVLWRLVGSSDWNREPLTPLGNDSWEGSFVLTEAGSYEYSIEGWIDPFLTWQEMLHRVLDYEQHLKAEVPVGLRFLEEMLRNANAGADCHDAAILSTIIEEVRIEECNREKAKIFLKPELSHLAALYQKGINRFYYWQNLKLEVARKKALFSSWYEMFPRSCAPDGGRHGTLNDCAALLPYVAAMGFDVVYLPPIHPIGTTHRKGRNNSLLASEFDPGSPWAVGSELGGHKALHPDLGTMEQFDAFIQRAKRQSLEVALDIAFQCSPDHPYVKEHPEWFRWRPDGTVQYAENPPKKYQDIVPFDFDTPAWQELWEELKSVILFWVAKGIRIFRVDNPHTKPFPFWEWLIAEVRKVDPSVIFLSEAFTRPNIMRYLAKIGFDQSYTYFTWRHAKHEIIEYVNELTKSPMRNYFRPNFWPNTPDILPTELQHAGMPAFIVRLILAATLSSNYGIYGPAYELCIGDAIEGSEEYLHSEKYEIKNWDRTSEKNIADVIRTVNGVRRSYKAFQTTWNVQFVETENEALLAYLKTTEGDDPDFLVVVNLDLYHKQAGMVHLPLQALGIDSSASFLVHDHLTGEQYMWQGERNYVELRPQSVPAHILRISPKMVRESNFDYYT